MAGPSGAETRGVPSTGSDPRCTDRSQPWLTDDRFTETAALVAVIGSWTALALGQRFLSERVFDVTFPLQFVEMAREPARIQLGLMGWQLIATLCIVLILWTAPSLRRTLVSTTDAVRFPGLFFLGALLAYLLNVLNVWPFSFRWAGESVLQYASNLLELNATVAVALLLASSVVLTPVLEELVFRAGTLRLLSRVGGCRVGIFASAALFAAAHISDFNAPPTTRTVNTVVWTFVLGYVLAQVVHRSDGSIGSAIALHAGVNAAWAVALLSAAASSV